MYESLFAESYKACDDLVLLTDEEVIQADPDYEIGGTRGNEVFSFTVTSMTSLSDWSNYDLDSETLTKLDKTKAKASVIR